MADRTGAVPDDAPKQSFRLLRLVLPKRLQPLLRGLRKSVLKEGYRNDEPFRSIYSYTQASLARQDSILAKAQQLVEDGVPGDFAECGVLDGGTAALLAYAARNDPGRNVHLFDAWQGLPNSTAEDGEGARKWVGEVVGSPRRVTSVLKKVGAAMDRVVFHRGWFEDTLPVSDIERLAFLHVDCDFYEPTKLVLNTLVPLVSPGGWVQIDDYTSFEGCRKAVDEFLADKPDLELIVEDKPGGAIYFRKP